MNLSTDLRAACEYLEDMGVCLSEDFRAAAVSDGIALVKPIGKSSGEAAFCEDISVLEPEEKRLLSVGNGAVISSDIPDLCADSAKTTQAIALFTGLDKSVFSLSDGRLYVFADSLTKAAEVFSRVMSKLDKVRRYVALSRKSADILSSFFQR